MNKNKPPCIRGLKEFRNGCPQKLWSTDNPDGCPAWIEKIVVYRGEQNNESPKEIVIKQCLDLWMFKLAWDQCSLLEGNQQATESFRNGMVQTGEDGKDYPKPDLGVIQICRLFNTVKNERKIALNDKII